MRPKCVFFVEIGPACLVLSFHSVTNCILRATKWIFHKLVQMCRFDPTDAKHFPEWRLPVSRTCFLSDNYSSCLSPCLVLYDRLFRRTSGGNIQGNDLNPLTEHCSSKVDLFTCDWGSCVVGACWMQVHVLFGSQVFLHQACPSTDGRAADT